jgi:prepilin-type N-terminal cleavage/methylation domain-containing protein
MSILGPPIVEANMRNTKGFTLIELLIVVAIIAILAAIAVPNFLEAQTRSKIARVKANQRTCATALEAYCVDENHYPPMVTYAKRVVEWPASVSLPVLTTPIAYLESLQAIIDPFFSDQECRRMSWMGCYAGVVDMGFPFEYVNFERDYGELCHPGENANLPSVRAWTITAFGPDHVFGSGPDIRPDADNGNGRTPPRGWHINVMSLVWNFIAVDTPYMEGGPDPMTSVHVNAIYDSSNGTTSRGDIARVGGQIPAGAERLVHGP